MQDNEVKWWNQITGEKALERPTRAGATFDPDLAQLRAAGWREVRTVEIPEDGYRVTLWGFQDNNDGETFDILIASDVSIADEHAAQEAAAQQAYEADLADNHEYYALQNGYLCLCDMLMGRNTHELVGASEILVRLGMLIKSDPVNGAKLQAAFTGAALALYGKNPEWHTEIKYRDVPAIVAEANALMGAM